mmetsp:Transcript_9288/g.20088  ORF Transcript_9288/g.20088 Transcript_9288/m.20088 type:complete len:350 (-) Transcript_9288:225-1274(-)|eukprot:CAMPEP_0168782488 /NCGR_PEP_ID=MMETSP0725-20121227/9190_1 /TAXON_ID=265536 /ORGANISM="Amphiprora sp., Strain CCMP467" /LENGTH=349 /DNA_ID=CAMNT_0008832423 /DNA_START=215 /DNA_END=1264 /DNA_ORIENTATION=+
MVLKRLFQTAFPRFKKKELEQVKNVAPALDDGSDTCSESGSSHSGDEAKNGRDFVAQFNKREAKYRRKEDEDVAMFMSLIDRMSVKSLVFLLQGHARSMHNIHEGELQQTLVMIHNEKKVEKMELEPATSRRPSQPKRCRFAEIMGGQKVRAVVVEIPHHSEYSPQEKASSWWTAGEMRAMRTEAAKVVQFFYQHRPEYSESVTLLSQSGQPDADDILVEHHVKKLAENSFPRGLEGHIVDSLAGPREAAIEAVLSLQEMYNAKPRKSFRQSSSSRSVSRSTKSTNEKLEWQAVVDEFWAEASKQYMAHSEPNKVLALKLAECDHIEALKASLSRWAPQIPPSSFFYPS